MVVVYNKRTRTGTTETTFFVVLVVMVVVYNKRAATVTTIVCCVRCYPIRVLGKFPALLSDERFIKV